MVQKMRSVPRARGGVVTLVIGWLLTLAVLWFGFQVLFERQANPNQVLSVSAGGDLILKRNRAGHYVANGEINGRPVTFLLDTGATAVALPSAVARELGLKPGQAVQLQTAAGPATGYTTRLASVKLGPIEMRDLSALISEGMQGDLVLLGMNFLKRVEMTQRGDELIIRPLAQK